MDNFPLCFFVYQVHATTYQPRINERRSFGKIGDSLIKGRVLIKVLNCTYGFFSSTLFDAFPELPQHFADCHYAASGSGGLILSRSCSLMFGNREHVWMSCSYSSDGFREIILPIYVLL